MRKLMVFNMMSLDGFIADSQGDMSWARKHDQEWNAFSSQNASGEAVLVFGRVTYDMMASYWPTPAAAEASPETAKRMNELQKIVFSRRTDRACWQNSTLLKGDLADEVRRLKAQSGADLVILGSASLVRQLAAERLIDGYQIAVNPVVLGGGKSMFANLQHKMDLRLVDSRTFKNGNVFLSYQPA
jgi:dihydrofolate reductase